MPKCPITGLIQHMLWRWLGAYSVDPAMLEGMQAAMNEHAARPPRL